MSFIQWLFVTESVAVSVIKLVLTLGAVLTGSLALALAYLHRDEAEATPEDEASAGDGQPPRWLLAHSRPRR